MSPHRSLSLEERGARALEAAADKLDDARNAKDFRIALEHNYRLWRTLRVIAQRQCWTTPNSRMADYAMSTTGSLGCGIDDDHVFALVNLNRRVSRALVADGMHIEL